MAAIITHPQSWRTAAYPSNPSTPVLAVALVPSVLDLLALLQHAPVLSTVALGASALAAIAVLVHCVRHRGGMEIWGAVLVLAASAAARWLGAPTGPVLSLLALLVLGLSGAFSTLSGPEDLVGLTSTPADVDDQRAA